MGMNAVTGETLRGIEHLYQSVRDILTTPIGSRAMRRDYGSRLYELIDAPIHDGTLLRIYAATADALRRWERRLRLTRVQATQEGAGHLALDLEGEYLPTGQPIRLEGIVVSRAA